jgi:hypothetical protein
VPAGLCVCGGFINFQSHSTFALSSSCSRLAGSRGARGAIASGGSGATSAMRPNDRTHVAIFFFIYIYIYIYMYISSAATRHARSPGRQARAPDVSRERVCARAGTRGDVLLLSRCGLGYIIYSRPAENCRSTKFGAAERKIGAARRLRTQPPLIKSSRQIFLNQARSTWPYLARYFVSGPTRWGHELGYGLVD